MKNGLMFFILLLSGTWLGAQNKVANAFSPRKEGNKATINAGLGCVKDTKKPVIGSIKDIIKGTSEGSCSSVVYFDLHATDNCSLRSLISVPASGSVFPLGVTVVTIKATDASGNTSTASFKVIVKDSIAPVISKVNVDRTILWPADHSMKNVTVNYNATDNCGKTTSRLSVTSNEPIAGTDSDDQSPDWQIIDAHHVQLRAERSSNGTGRIYQIKIISKDAAGNVVTQTNFVKVPLNNIPVLETIVVRPTNATVPTGFEQSFTVIGTFSDGSTQDLTATANWLSSDNSVATISNVTGSNGVATGVSSGTTQITAQSGLISGEATLTVTINTVLETIVVQPTNATVSPGLEQTFTAIGTFSDGSTQDLTATINWLSGDNSVATISNVTGSNGVATGVSSGTTQITAQFGLISGEATLTVTNSTVLETINVLPTNATVSTGLEQAFTAMGTFSDGSTQDLTATVNWLSSDNSVATISNVTGSNGVATGVSSGTTQIIAQSGLISGEVTLTVTNNAVLETINVLPTNATVPIGLEQTFTAIGTFSDGSTQDLTATINWLSSDNSVATISNVTGPNGVATGVSPGTTQITAQSGPISGVAMLTVTNTARADAKQITDVKNRPAEKLSAKLTARLIPNPAEREFNLVIKSSSNELVEIQVFDIIGHEVKRMRAATSGTLKFGQDFTKGTYVVVLRQGREKVILKAVKQ
jgi:hypothetical protein